MNYAARIDTADAQFDSSELGGLGDAEEQDRLSRRRVWVIGAICLAALIGLWFVLHHSSGVDSAKKGGSQAPVVTVISPGRGTIAGRINATGTLAARRELPVGAAGEGGQIAQVLVEPGQWVRQGQILAIVDRSVQVQQQASSAAQIQVAQADARLAQANLDRALKLVERGFISKADIDRLTATRDAAQARVRVASAQYGELGARIRRLNIVAPSAGLVLERKVEPGQIVSSGSGVLFRLAQGGEMELLAQLGETDLANISVGVSAEVTPAGSARSFTGQVWQISPVIDPQTRQGKARIALSYAPELRPGGYANVVIVAGSVVAPMLPESAVLSDNSGSYVYIVGPDNKVVRRAVKTGMLTGDGIVISEGLTGNERVVLRAGAFLTPGESVVAKAMAR
jgi:RND family efflux transporter MFP subunit